MTPLGLPVEDILNELKQQLSDRHEAVLEAPPGAGKTTLVPLALMDESWLQGKKVIMLEPRRIATKSAAHRLASLLNEKPGQRIGYRMRLDTKVSQHTQVEVITEGILTHMLQEDPSLDDVGLVIFDEYHERSLDSDLALSLCLKGRSLFRDEDNPLKLLVMSATLDGTAVSSLLGDAPIVTSEGRTYPVDVIYQRPKPQQGRYAKGRAQHHPGNRNSFAGTVDNTVETIQQAIAENPNSSVLAFLPGQGEIHRTTERLANWIQDRNITGVHLRPLFGNLSIEEQQQAIAPLTGAQANEQKIVLATNIAETSLTIEGVDVVVDSGLVRESVFNPSIGMSGLQTSRISQASSVQRAGRAGRLKPGKCYRLWTEEQQQQLAPQSNAEILNADLAPLALQLLQWGVDDPAELEWMDPPPNGHWQQAVDLLRSLGAIKQQGSSWVLTEHGQAMTTLSTHPRLAHLMLCGADIKQTKSAALLASFLSDRDPFSRDNPDIGHRLDILSGNAQCPSMHQGWLYRTKQLADQLEQQTHKAKRPQAITPLISADQLAGYLLACAYPDRIARRRHSGGYQLANGRSASFVGQPNLEKCSWLAVAEVSSQPSNPKGSKGDIIRSATELDDALFQSALSNAVTDHTVAEWDKQSNRFIAEQQRKIGALTLQRTRLDNVPAEAKSAALIEHIRKQGLNLLNWTPEIRQWCARVTLAKSNDSQHSWPDVSETGLLTSLDKWLGPYLSEVNTLNDFKKIKLAEVLHALTPWDQQQALNQLVPTHFHVPSGSKIRIDYTENPPVLAVKLQEMFGCETTPTVLNGKVPLLVHLLSPAGRPLQVTQDLAGFWRTSYHDVKKDMKGRYPKHPWPDDPLVAIATRKTKHRL